eukprot:TRINITY_DN10190_c0_g1_i5.p1 TRINITY_DN10190_c0_g1~~TRINITY_DN10190_c0_g1_i5.p1  ORF type:complete len:254 (-),score=40.61 TRINITY_DN10190_c0_g1_i5:16-777(-)
MRESGRSACSMVMALIRLLMGMCILGSIDMVSFWVIVGKPCGYGQYTWKNGSTFVGEFLNGLKSGFGKYRKTKANRTNMYEGEYLKDKKEGFGIFKWASGNIYRGQYKEDEREGIGEMRWVDGSSYIGQWERGIQHGYGRMKFPDGSVKEGLFENNIYKGPATKGEVPPELRKTGFDIMSLAPKGVAFSSEICYWNTALPQSETPRFELPLLKSSRSENVIVKKMARYLGLSLIHICRCRRYAVCRSRWSPYH